MFNPTYPFTTEVLHATVATGCHYFVRNTYHRSFDHFHNGIKGYFIITHYNDVAKATAHYNSIPHDKARFLYDWSNPEHRKRLETAASQPTGFLIYSTYFLPDYKKLITPRLKDKMNTYMRKHTSWKPGKGEKVNVDLYMQFGELYTAMTYAGEEIRIKFADIESV